MRSYLVCFRTSFYYLDSLIGNIVCEQPQTSLLVSLRNLKGQSDREQHGQAAEERPHFHLKPKSTMQHTVLQGDFLHPCGGEG